MRRPEPRADWPASWHASHLYDLEEVYGEPRNLGYAYAYHARRERTLALLTEVLEPGGSVLDIAAAQGNFSIALAERGYAVTWNDLRAELIDYVKSKHEHGAITYAPGNAFELESPGRFDAVLATEVIEHVAHPDQFLRRAAQLVRPGGWLVLTTPNGGYFRNTLPSFSACADPARFEAIQFGPNSDDHVFLLHAGEMHDLATKAGLEVERVELFTNPLTNGHIKLAPLLRVLSRAVVDGIEALSARLPPVLAQRVLVQMAVRLRRPAAAALPVPSSTP